LRINLIKKHINDTDEADLRSWVFLAINAPDTGRVIEYKAFREYVTHLMESKYIDYLAGLSIDNVSEICRLTGLSRSRIYQLLNKHKKRLI
jgi:hypothetical protein